MIDTATIHQKAVKTYAASLDGRAGVPSCVEMPKEGRDASCVRRAHVRNMSVTEINTPTRLPLALEPTSAST